MKSLTQIKSMKVEEKRNEVEYIKKLLFYTKRAADETGIVVMKEQQNRLREFLKLIGISRYNSKEKK